MFMYGDSGQNKLNVNEKKLTLISIRGKNFALRQFMCTCSKNITIFIKNDITILKLFLTVAARKSFVFVFWFMKKTPYIGIVIF